MLNDPRNPEPADRERIAALEQRVAELSARVDAIYGSRIWKILSSAGGVLLWLTGRRPTARPATHDPPPATSAQLPITNHQLPATSHQLLLNCEHPPPDTIARATEKVEIRGWAASPSGIQSVEILIDGQAPIVAKRGGLTPEIAERYPEHPGAMFSGFKAVWDTRSASTGRHRLEVRVTAGDGQVGSVAREMMVDGRSDYEVWIEKNEPSKAELHAMAALSQDLLYQPVISIATPVYRTPLSVLDRTVASVREQAYPNWEFCLVDDDSKDPELTAALARYAAEDPRIKVWALPSNTGIARATNECIALCTGEFVGFLDHDDELAPNALFEIVRVLNQSQDIDIFYTDEDKISQDGRRYGPFFKPRWSPDLLCSFNYITHFLVCRRSLLNEVGGLRTGFDGSQDYDLILRLSERSQRIHRIPKVLYHWRAVAGSVALQGLAAKPEAEEAGRRAIEEHVRRMGEPADVEVVGAARYRARYRLQNWDPVSVIIPTGGNLPKLRVALQSLIEKTDYPEYEVVIVDNSRDEPLATSHQLPATGHPGTPIRILDQRFTPFNFSRLCNDAARTVNSPFLLFLNDDTEVVSGDWLRAMMEHGSRDGVGAVGALLMYPDETIQHAGVILGVSGLCGHAFAGGDTQNPDYFGLPLAIRNVSAVTAACMLVSTSLFLDLGGFDENNLAEAYQDVDFCLRILDSGRCIVYTPHARLIHHESSSKNVAQLIVSPQEAAFLRLRWRHRLSDDPYYNPNLSRERTTYEVRLSEAGSQ